MISEVLFSNDLNKSAFVGCASIILLLPAPGYFAAKLQTVQRKKMTVVSLLHFSTLSTACSLYLIHGNRLMLGFKLFRRVSSLWR